MDRNTFTISGIVWQQIPMFAFVGISSFKLCTEPEKTVTFTIERNDARNMALLMRELSTEPGVLAFADEIDRLFSHTEHRSNVQSSTESPRHADS